MSDPIVGLMVLDITSESIDHLLGLARCHLVTMSKYVASNPSQFS
jgi:hypothetical protein